MTKSYFSEGWRKTTNQIPCTYYMRDSVTSTFEDLWYPVLHEIFLRIWWTQFLISLEGIARIAPDYLFNRVYFMCCELLVSTLLLLEVCTLFKVLLVLYVLSLLLNGHMHIHIYICIYIYMTMCIFIYNIYIHYVYNIYILYVCIYIYMFT